MEGGGRGGVTTAQFEKLGEKGDKKVVFCRGELCIGQGSETMRCRMDFQTPGCGKKSDSLHMSG